MEDFNWKNIIYLIGLALYLGRNLFFKKNEESEEKKPSSQNEPKKDTFFETLLKQLENEVSGKEIESTSQPKVVINKSQKTINKAENSSVKRPFLNIELSKQNREKRINRISIIDRLQERSRIRKSKIQHLFAQKDKIEEIKTFKNINLRDGIVYESILKRPDF